MHNQSPSTCFVCMSCRKIYRLKNMLQLHLRIEHALEAHDDDSSIFQITMAYTETLSLVINAALENKDVGTLATPARRCEWLDALRILNNTTTRLVDILAHAWQMRQTILNLAQALECNTQGALESTLWADDKAVVGLLVRAVPGIRHDSTALRDDLAVGFLDLCDAILHSHSWLPEIFPFSVPDDLAESHLRDIYRLSIDLARASSQLPSRIVMAGTKLETAEPVGGGAYADVFKGVVRGRQVSIKRFRIFEFSNGKKELQNAIAQVVAALRLLRHENICELVGVDRTLAYAGTDCLVVPWMRHGNLNAYLHERPWVENDILLLIADVLRGLSYIHQKKLVHGNIHMGNILVDDQRHARLTDIGLSGLADVMDSHNTSAVPGSSRCLAPEILRPSLFDLATVQYTTASDTYAFGQICWQAYTGRIPFHDMNHRSVVFAITEGKHPERISSTRLIPDTLWEAMMSCWQFRPTERPQAHELLCRLEALLA